ncbi:TonB-dependent receptor [Fulvivirgaceae bacterium PWU5]|uniref:TonB-dependent receptor n=1 Tax=Dawidia cretensis TaxID=2782350 RepID=A0AAP2GPN7_9BACT|nr:TonB-dependent receptor [Dawidia cretensis]MBT1708419.1 TonB-dependent receptor [Dawidia cretensis]
MARKLLCYTLLLMLPAFALAQNGSISGNVKMSDNSPATQASITVKGTTIGTTADEKGNYLIKSIKAGNYVIVASGVGLEKKEQSVTVTAGGNAVVDFLLAESSALLQEVNVSAFKAKNNTIVAKMPLADLENPQVYSSVPAELMKEQGIVNYDDAFRNVPGISRTWGSTGREGDGGAYFALRGFETQPTLTNGLPGLTNGNLDIANVEEIQVIKGPSATLFGGTTYSYGGMINTITKKPVFDSFSGEVAYNIGSFDLHRVSIDINTPLSKTEKIAFRLNAAYHTEESFQDAGFKKSFFIAPSLAWEVNDKLSFTVMAEILSEKRAVAPVFFNTDRVNPLPFNSIESLNLNPKLSFTDNDLTIKNPRLNFQAQAVYKISDQWQSQTVLSGGSAKSDGIYSYIYDDENANDEYFDLSFHVADYDMKTVDIQQNFNGDFRIGGLRNRLLVGFDYYRRNATDQGSGYGVGRRVTPQGDKIGGDLIFDEDGNFVGEEAPIPLTRSAVDALVGPTGEVLTDIENSTASMYVSDVINFTPKFSAMVSLRADHFDSNGDKSNPDDDYSQFSVSPKLGLQYQPVLNKVSVFANYMNAFVNVEPRAVYDEETFEPTGEVRSYKPEHANQFEFGVKTYLSEKFSATVSYYNIKVSDRVVDTPAGTGLQTGAVRSKGFEIDLSAQPAHGLELIAGFSHNSNKVVDPNPENPTDFYNEVGRASGGQGPSDQVNLWATYRFSSSILKNFGVGVGGNYASEYRVVDNSVTGTFDLPSYMLLNGTVFYNAKKYRVNFSVNNITDEQYYIGYWSVNPQKQRNFTAAVAYKF